MPPSLYFFTHVSIVYTIFPVLKFLKHCTLAALIDWLSYTHCLIDILFTLHDNLAGMMAFELVDHIL